MSNTRVHTLTQPQIPTPSIVSGLNSGHQHEVHNARTQMTELQTIISNSSYLKYMRFNCLSQLITQLEFTVQSTSMCV